MAHYSGLRNANRSRILRRTGFVGSLGLTAVLLSGCSAPNNVVLRFGWPEGITPQAERMRELWTWSVIAALIMGVLVWGLTFWTVYFHRKSAEDARRAPEAVGYNVPLELGYTAVPFVIIAVLFYFTVVVQNYVEEKPANPDVAVDVTAFQWNWKFGYRSVIEDGVVYDGRDTVREDANALLAQESAERVNEEGEERPGPIHGLDDSDLSYLHYDKIETVGTSYEIPVLVLPTGKRIQFTLASSDVIHSFWVPEFLFKRDVNPNPDREPLRERLPDHRDRPGRCVRRPLRGDVRHLPRDDELRGPRGVAGGVRSLHPGAQADRPGRARAEQRGGAGLDRRVAGRDLHPPVQYRPHRP